MVEVDELDADELDVDEDELEVLTGSDTGVPAIRQALSP